MTEGDPDTSMEFGGVPKAEDLEAAFFATEIDGNWYLEIRDRVISTARPGRGIFIPMSQMDGVLSKIVRVADWWNGRE